MEATPVQGSPAASGSGGPPVQHMMMNNGPVAVSANNPGSVSATVPGSGGATSAVAAPRDKYRVVPKAKTTVGENEIRVTNAGRLNRYVTYAARLLSDNGQRSITIRATGNAIAGAITLSEILKRRFSNLHQQNIIGVTTISDIYEPLEEGLDEVRRERNVPFIEIIIAVDANCLNVSDPGYQEPIDQSLVKPYTPEVPMAPGTSRGGRGRGRGRGSYNSRGGGVGHAPGGGPSYNIHREPYRGRYRGRRVVGPGGSSQQHTMGSVISSSNMMRSERLGTQGGSIIPPGSVGPPEIVMAPNYPQVVPQGVQH